MIDYNNLMGRMNAALVIRVPASRYEAPDTNLDNSILSDRSIGMRCHSQLRKDRSYVKSSIDGAYFVNFEVTTASEVK